jgi:hypothetical protein
MKLLNVLVLTIALTAATIQFTGAAEPLVIDEESGHYRDLSYDALTDKRLSWQQRMELFGGESADYGELTDGQRAAGQRELETLLARIGVRESQKWADPQLLHRVEAEILAWLDGQIEPVTAIGSYTGADVQRLRNAAVGFFRAHEIFGGKKYLEAGLKCAERILASQWPRGHWPWPGKGERFIRIQDGTTTRPFWIMLYAYRLSGDRKYLESAVRCADVLLSIKRPGGGWGDQWAFGGGRSGNSGVYHGTSFNDGATNDPFQIMVMAYHLTGDKKYIDSLHEVGEFIAKARMGESHVVGWCEQYNDDARPVRARQYEIELPYPRALTRGVGPLLIWLYLMDGNEAHMDLLRSAYVWHERVRQKELDPVLQAQWKAMARAWSPSHHILTGNYLMEYRPGWPDAWLPDGSNWGRVLGFRMMAWNPLTPGEKKKYGNLVDHSWPPVAELAKLADAHKPPPRGYNMYVHCHSGIGNSLSEIRRALLEHKRGARAGMLKYYSHPTRYTADQYLQARIHAARRVLDMRNRRLAFPYTGRPGYTGMSTAGDFGFISTKGRWYGDPGTKWGAAFQTVYPSGNTIWYQWQLVYDAKLARGQIDADTAARGGRGLESVAMHTHLDSWDVLGEWGMASHEMENYFDVPLGKK